MATDPSDAQEAPKTAQASPKKGAWKALRDHHRTSVIMKQGFGFIKGNDLKPLPGLLKNIGEDVAGLIQKKQKETQQEIKELQVKAQEKDERIVELEQCKAELESKLREESEQKERLSRLHKKELDSANEQLLTKVEALTSLETKHRTACENVQTLEESLAESVKDYQLLNVTHLQLRKKEAEVRAELANTSKALGSEVAEYKRKSVAAEKELDRLQKRDDMLTEKNDDLRKENAEMKSSLRVLEGEHESQTLLLRQREKELREKADDVSRLERNSQEMVQKYKKAEAMVERLRKELATHKESSNHAVEQNNALSKQLGQTNQTMERLRLQVSELKKLVEQNDPKRLLEIIEHMTARLDDARTITRHQKEQNQLLTLKNEDLHSALTIVERDLTLERQFLPVMHSLQGPIGTAGRAMKRCSSRG